MQSMVQDLMREMFPEAEKEKEEMIFGKLRSKFFKKVQFKEDEEKPSSQLLDAIDEDKKDSDDDSLDAAD